MRTITVEANETFIWSPGLRLVPREKVTIVLPGSVISGGQQIGQIINVSDNAHIGFQPSNKPGETFSHIILKVNKGDAVQINRRTEARLVCDEGRAVVLDVE